MENNEDTPGKVSGLLKMIRVGNLVPEILEREDGEDILTNISARVVEDQTSDKTSMAQWETFLIAGRKLQQQELEPKSEPFDNAANFKTPVLLESSLKFGDRASSTLLKPRELVKFDVIGKDPDQKKAKRGERISTHMSYQLNYEQKTWRKDQDSLLYMAPSDGAVFKWTYFDAGLGTNVSEIVRWPDFSVNQANNTMDEARSFTIIREYSESVVLSKQREGIWQNYPDMEIGTESQAEHKTAAESSEKFFIQQMYFDLDEDGYEEPYLAVVHESSGKLMRLTARFEEDNIMVKAPNGKVLQLSAVLAGADNLGIETTGDDEVDKKNPRINQVSLVRINPINQITEYFFIPGSILPFDKEGAFLGIGYVHLLAGLTQAINSTSNTILNAGKLASTPGGFLAKGFRKATGTLRFKVGSYIPTLMSAADLQNSVREHTFRGPDQAFYAFNEKMNAEVQRLSASADLTNAIGANAPATTMLGMVQEQLMPASAITQRIYRSMKEEFMKLAELNRKYTDPEVYLDVVGEPEQPEEMIPEEIPQAPEAEQSPQEPQDQVDPVMAAYSYAEDYDMKGLDVMPAANPQLTSKMQNIMQSSALLEQADRILQYGGNPIPIMKKYIINLGEDDVNQIFPPENDEPDPQLVAMRQAQALESEMAKEQIRLFGEQVKNEKAKTAISKAKAIAEIKETISKAILNLEKAETEETKNQITKYTTQMESLVRVFENQMAQEDPQIKQALEAPQQSAIENSQ